MLRSRLLSVALLIAGVLVASIGIALTDRALPFVLVGFALAAWAEVGLWMSARLPTRSRTARGRAPTATLTRNEKIPAA